MWGGVTSTMAHSGFMHALWLQHHPSLSALKGNGVTTFDGDNVREEMVCSAGRSFSAVSVSTGLGLPLSRSFALAGGGWAGIEDVEKPVLSKRYSWTSDTGTASVTVQEVDPSWTQFWAVMDVTFQAPAAISLSGAMGLPTADFGTSLKRLSLSSLGSHRCVTSSQCLNAILFSFGLTLTGLQGDEASLSLVSALAVACRFCVLLSNVLCREPCSHCHASGRGSRHSS